MTKFVRILVWHLLIGVPAATLAHSLVQYAYDPEVGVVWVVPHFLFGLGCGLPILVPAYTLQAGIFTVLFRWHAPAVLQAVVGGLLQAGLVGLWAATVGVQPSLGGNFPMTPVMIGAATCVGALVALVNVRLVAR